LNLQDLNQIAFAEQIKTRRKRRVLLAILPNYDFAGAGSCCGVAHLSKVLSAFSYHFLILLFDGGSGVQDRKYIDTQSSTAHRKKPLISGKIQ